MLHIYPDSLFILTVRDPDEWYTIASAHYRNMVVAMGAMPIRVSRMLTTVFGTNNYEHKTLWIAAYNRHNREVQRVVDKDRLLVMDMSNMEVDGYKQLCPFLEKIKEKPCWKFAPFMKFPTTEINNLGHSNYVPWTEIPFRYAPITVSNNQTRFAYVSKLFNPNLPEQRGFLTSFLIAVEGLRQAGSFWFFIGLGFLFSARFCSSVLHFFSPIYNQ